jgi:hypothetical protein
VFPLKIHFFVRFSLIRSSFSRDLSSLIFQGAVFRSCWVSSYRCKWAGPVQCCPSAAGAGLPSSARTWVFTTTLTRSQSLLFVLKQTSPAPLDFAATLVGAVAGEQLRFFWHHVLLIPGPIGAVSSESELVWVCGRVFVVIAVLAIPQSWLLFSDVKLNLVLFLSYWIKKVEFFKS